MVHLGCPFPFQVLSLAMVHFIQSLFLVLVFLQHGLLLLFHFLVVSCHFHSHSHLMPRWLLKVRQVGPKRILILDLCQSGMV
jgi:hypothetical protein